MQKSGASACELFGVLFPDDVLRLQYFPSRVELLVYADDLTITVQTEATADRATQQSGSERNLRMDY